jgi:hypothetical protein
MARRVFFSFHYQKDIWRVNQVRNSGEFTDVTGVDTFYDNSLWEAAKKKGEAALKKLIAEGMHNSSMTTVLAASETWRRPWVVYEMVKSFERGNGLMTLWIDQVKDAAGKTSTRGYNPLACVNFELTSDGKAAAITYYDGSIWKAYGTIDAAHICQSAKTAKKGALSDLGSSHSWSAGNAKEFAGWADAAAKAAGR